MAEGDLTSSAVSISMASADNGTAFVARRSTTRIISAIILWIIFIYFFFILGGLPNNTKWIISIIAVINFFHYLLKEFDNYFKLGNFVIVVSDFGFFDRRETHLPIKWENVISVTREQELLIFDRIDIKCNIPIEDFSFLKFPGSYPLLQFAKKMLGQSLPPKIERTISIRRNSIDKTIPEVLDAIWHFRARLRP